MNVKEIRKMIMTLDLHHKDEIRSKNMGQQKRRAMHYENLKALNILKDKRDCNR